MRKTILVLLLLLSSAPAFGAVVRLSTPAIQRQQTPVWCWAASIQNVLSSYNVQVTQQQVVQATYGGTANLPLFDPRQAALNLLQANSLVAPQQQVVHPFFVSGPPRPDVLVREIKRERSPLLVFYQNPSGGGHVVVCYGIEYTGTEMSPIITRVFIKDPFDASEKTWGGNQLAQLWNATIFLRVAPRPPAQVTYNNESYSLTPYFELFSPYRNRIEGRLWYFNESHAWHIFNPTGNDLGAIP